ncbi:MAG: hypothetical protein ACLP9Y_05490 [Mycobacterium sp.]
MRVDGQHPGLMVAGTAVIIEGPMLKHALLGIQHIIQRRRHHELPVPAEWVALEAALTRAMSACPASDLPDTVIGDHGSQMVTTREGAAMLGVTERHIRRLAPRLGGKRVAGRWLLDDDALREHIEGATR